MILEKTKERQKIGVHQMNKPEIIKKEVPHEKNYCYLAIVDLLGKIVSENDKTKRILIYSMIMREIKHLL